MIVSARAAAAIWDLSGVAARCGDHRSRPGAMLWAFVDALSIGVRAAAASQRGQMLQAR